jgi:hypothetical protein
MAQTQSPTKEGYGELAKLQAGEAATAVKSIVCLKTACTADEDQTAAGITKSTESGLTKVDADSVKSVKVTNDPDAVQVDHVFTAGEAATVKGFAVLNDDDDVVYGICCFAADVPLESGDKVTDQMKIQHKKGS